MHKNRPHELREVGVGGAGGEANGLGAAFPDWEVGVVILRFLPPKES